MSMLDDISNKNVWMIGAVVTGISVIPIVKSGSISTMASSIEYMQTASKHLPNADSQGSNSSNSNSNSNSNQSNNTGGDTSKGKDTSKSDNNNQDSNFDITKQPIQSDQYLKDHAIDQEQNGYHFSTMTSYQDGHYPDNNEGLLIINYTGSQKNITIPSYTKHNGKVYQINYIMQSAFENRGLTQLAIPEVISMIGPRAFYRNHIKNTVNIPRQKGMYVGVRGDPSEIFDNGVNVTNNPN